MKVATYLGSLAHLCCGEGETAQTEKHCRHVWEALTVDGPHWGCTVQGSIHFPGSSHLCSWLLHEGTNSASQVGHVSILGSWSLAATLPAAVSRPESQEVLVSNEACLQFGR